MTADDALKVAVSAYGRAVKRKLTSPAISGEPEEQLRTPLHALVKALAAACGVDASKLDLVGETPLGALRTRPDFAVTLGPTLVGFIEVKAPGKGADPRRFRGHDRDQWQKLSALPNLLYTDGQKFALCRDGELASKVVELDGEIDIAGSNLAPPPGLRPLFQDFFSWEPIVPRRPKQLAAMTARLCRLLRDEVTEQLKFGSRALSDLAAEWRQLLFPDASDEQFADGYAQTVTFGLLLARARGIDLSRGIDAAARELGKTHSLIGTALRVVTESVVADKALNTSNLTLRRVLAQVDWPTVSRGDPDAWLYFYEDFLAEYDAVLRRRTGSYYTPVDVVRAMTRLTNEALQERFGLIGGLAEPNVTVLDPAMGTGTFLLEVLRSIAATVEEEQGAGAVPAAMVETLKRVMGFELQLGPFAVAQLRLLAELAELGAEPLPPDPLKAYVANTLDNPYVEDQHLGQLYEPIARSRREANRIKKHVPITAVIGNPPYKAQSGGKGGWIEAGNPGASQPAPLRDFMPPPEWGVGAHTKHLHNLYVYFWRWATWKVFDDDSGLDTDRGVVSFITVAGFLTGPGFQRMRAYLRDRADAVWVIDCSPEGHQPPVHTRVFQGVQHPVCITIAVRDGSTADGEPAVVRYRSLAPGHRDQKFTELGGIALGDDDWLDCPTDPRAPLLPESDSDWQGYPGLDDLFRWSGSGIMPGRTWVVAPDPDTLRERWDTLTCAPADKKPELLQEHPSDRRVDTVLKDGLPGYPPPSGPIGTERGPCPDPVRIGYRTLDCQWIIPDKRVINRPNPTLWSIHSSRQVYLTALTQHSPRSGPGLTATGLVPDLHHYRGSFGGRAYPLWLDANASAPNVVPALLDHLAHVLDMPVTAEDVFAYVAAVVSHPGYTASFADDLQVPGIRVPLTAGPRLFARAVDVGRRVLWLHTHGERYADPAAGRPGGPPHLAIAPKVTIPIPSNSDDMPDMLAYNPSDQELHVGKGMIANVTPAMWAYEVSGVNVLTKWFSYRRKNRERPVIGDRRTSPLGDIHIDHWLASYTRELIQLLNVVGLLTELEPTQADLLAAIRNGRLITTGDLTASAVLPVPPAARKPGPIVGSLPPVQPQFGF